MVVTLVGVSVGLKSGRPVTEKKKELAFKMHKIVM